jgi:hypothetical protein
LDTSSSARWIAMFHAASRTAPAVRNRPAAMDASAASRSACAASRRAPRCPGLHNGSAMPSSVSFAPRFDCSRSSRWPISSVGAADQKDLATSSSAPARRTWPDDSCESVVRCQAASTACDNVTYWALAKGMPAPRPMAMPKANKTDFKVHLVT